MKNLQIRMTKQRRIILEEMRKALIHPTAEEIYSLVRKRLPNISLGTIYRNLDVLVSLGEVKKLTVGGSVCRFDANIAKHYHVRCRTCGRVGDVRLSEEAPDFSFLKASAHDFFVTGAKLEFEGLCRKCSEN